MALAIKQYPEFPLPGEGAKSPVQVSPLRIAQDHAESAPQPPSPLIADCDSIDRDNLDLQENLSRGGAAMFRLNAILLVAYSLLSTLLIAGSVFFWHRLRH